MAEVVVRPKNRPTDPSGGISKTRNNTGGTGGTGGGGGGGGNNAYLKAQRDAENRANRRAQQEKNKAARAHRQNAETLQVRADALKQALKEYGNNRKIKLGNIRQQLDDAERLLMTGFDQRRSDLLGSASDNEAAAEASTTEAGINRGRERAAALSEAALQGAGETDALRVQALSLQNWAANQGEVQRSMFDTLRSINSTIGDLNVDTRTGLANAHVAANEDRAQVWQDFYNRRSDTMTELGNVYGQQSEYYSKANELAGNKGGGGNKLRSSITSSNGVSAPDYTNLKNKDAMERTREAAARNYRQASKVQGRAYKDPGVPNRIQNFEGQAPVETTNNLSFIGSLQGSMKRPERAEGASLRKW